MGNQPPLEDFALTPEQIAEHYTRLQALNKEQATKRAKIRKRRESRFAMMPLDWSTEMGKVLHSAEQMVVLMQLVYHTTFANGVPFAATAAKTGNVWPRTKIQTLRLLEAAGVVEIEWRGRGRNQLILQLKL
jgi:hypothetical protein